MEKLFFDNPFIVCVDCLAPFELICSFRLGEPNCQIEKWVVKGKYCLAIFAMKNIKEGEELTFNYHFSFYNENSVQKCECGSKNCTGIIGERRGGHSSEKSSARPIENSVNVKNSST